MPAGREKPRAAAGISNPLFSCRCSDHVVTVYIATAKSLLVRVLEFHGGAWNNLDILWSAIQNGIYLHAYIYIRRIA
jgi:hypothetical protein